MTTAEIARQARGLIEKSAFADAERLIQTTLERRPEPGAGEDPRDPRDPGQIELLYMLAVAQRYQQKADAALATLQQLLTSNPQYARAYQERGHLLLGLAQHEPAMAALSQAVALNPSLVGSWRALLPLLQARGEQLEWQQGQEQLKYLESLPPALLAVNSLLHEGQYHRADQLCRHFLRDNRDHAEGMRLLAAIGDQLEVLQDAEFLLETCIELHPDFLRARYDLANLLLKMQKFDRAFEQTTHLVAQAPENLAFVSLHANATAGIGEQEAAIALYNTVLDKSPAQSSLLIMRGHAEKTLGRANDAIGSYQQAYTIRPDHGDAYWSLANTKTYRFTAAEIDKMQVAEAATTTTEEDRIHLCFALGKALEDQQQFAASFEYYERGNALQLNAIKARPAPPGQRVDAQMAVCTREFFSARGDTGATAADPIFILGLPRAGSTLLEQILASHSQVDGTMELPQIIALSQRLRHQAPASESSIPAYPRILAELDADYFKRFGEQFLADTQVYRAGAAHFIDKNPNNFFHIGLIKLILPNAKVIDARRHPMSCCFSGFKQLFGQGQDFSYGLREVGTYYREYVRLMAHWDEVLPGFVLRVQHEDVLDDLEGQVRRLLEFCELPFEQSCLEYYNTDRNVRTPSSEQVRQPIFRTSVDAWQHFEPWLEPLKDALGPAIREQYGL